MATRLLQLKYVWWFNLYKTCHLLPLSLSTLLISLPASLPTHSTLPILASLPFLELNMLTCTSGPLSLPILFPPACGTLSPYLLISFGSSLRSHFLHEATLAQPISNYNHPNSPTLLILLPDLFFLYSTSHHLTS